MIKFHLIVASRYEKKVHINEKNMHEKIYKKNKIRQLCVIVQ